MSVIGRMGEAMARSINRRQALKRASVVVFGVVSALAVRGPRGDSALAGYCTYITTGDCTCNPADGAYCNRFDESFCDGARCSGGCKVDDVTSYVGGCWCSATCTYPGDNGGRINGYYKCCDCNCGGSRCSCREFIEGTSESRGVGALATGGGRLGGGGGDGSLFGEGGLFGSVEQGSGDGAASGATGADTYSDTYADTYSDTYADTYTDSYAAAPAGDSAGQGGSGSFPSGFPFGN
ncbi:MAG: hypothetical protein ACKOWF_02290 [Chloroflexota bacterium]